MKGSCQVHQSEVLSAPVAIRVCRLQPPTGPQPSWCTSSLTVTCWCPGDSWKHRNSALRLLDQAPASHQLRSSLML